METDCNKNKVMPGPTLALQSGEFAFVPGSHKPESGSCFLPQHNNRMPGHRALPGTAGTAIAFNSSGLHTVMANPARTPGRFVLSSYEKRMPERISPSAFAALSHRCSSPKRRALFGLEP